MQWFAQLGLAETCRYVSRSQIDGSPSARVSLIVAADSRPATFNAVARQATTPFQGKEAQADLPDCYHSSYWFVVLLRRHGCSFSH